MTVNITACQVILTSLKIVPNILGLLITDSGRSGLLFVESNLFQVKVSNGQNGRLSFKLSKFFFRNIYLTLMKCQKRWSSLQLEPPTTSSKSPSQLAADMSGSFLVCPTRQIFKVGTNCMFVGG